MENKQYLEECYSRSQKIPEHGIPYNPREPNYDKGIRIKFTGKNNNYIVLRDDETIPKDAKITQVTHGASKITQSGSHGLSGSSRLNHRPKLAAQNHPPTGTKRYPDDPYSFAYLELPTASNQSNDQVSSSSKTRDNSKRKVCALDEAESSSQIPESIITRHKRRRDQFYTSKNEDCQFQVSPQLPSADPNQNKRKRDLSDEPARKRHRGDPFLKTPDAEIG